jgi:transcription termination factor Rho
VAARADREAPRRYPLLTASLEKEHLARLHELAAKVGVPGYRRLRREELIEEIGARSDGELEEPASDAKAESDADAEGESDSETEPKAKPQRRRSRRGGRGGRGRDREREPEQESDDDELPAEDEKTEPTAGVLDVVAAGHGFLRLKGMEPDADDVYISASQIRRCELRAGDEVEGPARPPRRGERHPALVRVERVNGEEPGEERTSGFDDLTPVIPSRRIPLAPDSDDVLVRSLDLLAPLAFGQRVLIVCEPRSGRSTLLRGLVKAIEAADDAPPVIVLLVDERPEEVTEWRRQVPDVEIAAAPADLEAADQVRHAELALARAKRRAESGEDVVMVIDSLTRLGVAYRDPMEIKPAFGAGRELEEEGSGSLTIIATVLRGTEDGEGALEAVETTENAKVVLDADLAAAGAETAIDATATTVASEDKLREGDELEAARRLRESLRDADPREAAESLAERIRSSASNAELLSSL